MGIESEEWERGRDNEGGREGEGEVGDRDRLERKGESKREGGEECG